MIFQINRTKRSDEIDVFIKRKKVPGNNPKK